MGSYLNIQHLFRLRSRPSPKASAWQTGQALAATVSKPRLASANVPAEPILSLKGAHQMNSIETIAIEKSQGRRLRKSIPKPACPGCRMIKNDWPGEGYTHDGE